MIDRTSLRLAATLLLVGNLVFLFAGILHPGREPANSHQAVFTEYATNTSWIAVHLGQFAGMVLIIAGLLVLFTALNVQTGTAAWVARFGAVSAVVTLALYGVLQAIDGVALKHAVDAWVAAPAAEKAARFAAAETVRWLEWGGRSYHGVMFGVSFLLFGVVIAVDIQLPRAIGVLMAVTGLTYLAQGWIVGTEGFSANNTLPTLIGYLVSLIWIIWLGVVAWRQKTPSVAQ